MRASSRSSRTCWSEARASPVAGRRAANLVGAVRLVLAFAAGGAQPALARGGGGPPGWTMTLNYCRETVTNKGIADATRFEQEVKKCFANPVTYPPAYPKPTW
jgi:hypothetical protein